MNATWSDIPGITVVDGRPRLPRSPQVAALLLVEAAREADPGITFDQLVDRVRRATGEHPSRLQGLAGWLPTSRVARWRADGSLSLHPQTDAGDLALRYGAWLGSQPVPRDALDLVKRHAATVVDAARSAPVPPRPAPMVDAALAWMDEAPGGSRRESVSPREAMPLTAKLERLLAAFDASFLERRAQVRAALLALLAGQHTLLLGPPGTAKSLLARGLCQAIEGATYFEYLLSRFTHPDELFGPVSIPGLKNEDYRRLTEGFLPVAHVAFLDEIFKANSAILNSLLTLINERVFHHGRHRDPAPLLGLVGASNELPDPDGGLGALYDRFLVRLTVPPLAEPSSFLDVALGRVRPLELPADARLTLDEVAELRARATQVTAPDEVAEALIGIWRHASEAEWRVSDRRWRQALDVLRVAAASEGRTALQPTDLLLLEPMLADEPTEAATVRDALLAHLHPSAVPEHDLRAQWVLMHSDAVAPTPRQPLVSPPAADAPWSDRLTTRRQAVARFLDHHKEAVDRLADHRGHIEALARTHLWLDRVPVEMLAPHIESARDLAAILRTAERFRAQLADEGSVLDAVLGWLPVEDRVPAANMELVIGFLERPGTAIGMAYRRWKRIDGFHDGPVAVQLDTETFFDWLAGARRTQHLVDHLVAHQGYTRAVRDAGRHFEELREALAGHVVPAPPSLPSRPTRA